MNALAVGFPLRIIVAAVSASLLVFVAATAAQDGADAAALNPKGSACLDNPETVDPNPLSPGDTGECDGDATPGAKTALTSTFGIIAPDASIGSVVTFTPSAWTVARDGDVPDGALAARLTAHITAGVLNGPCNSGYTVSFDVLDATTDRSQAVTLDDDPGDADTKGEQFEEENGLPLGVTRYPDYLTRILVDKAAGGQPLQLRARLYGQSVVSGVDVSLNFAVLEPGATLRGQTFDPALGYPAVAVLQSIGDPDAQPLPAPLTDFCAPLEAALTTYGIAQNNPKTTANEAGATLRANPSAAGEYTFVTSVSLRDADNDGFDNVLDTCPFSPNPGWDPRQAGVGDADKDGLPDNCDPLPDDKGNPGVGDTNDHDGDGYQNRQDNCPLAKNSLGIGYITEGGPDNQGDRDGDGIGNACDNAGEGGIGKGPDIADSDLQVACVTSVVKIGAGGPAADPNVKQRLPCGPGVGATPTPPGQTPAPTLRPGETPGSGSGTQGGAGIGGPTTGIGSLAPVASSVPAWAAIVAALGGAGVFASLGALAPRLLRRWRQ